MTYRFFLILLFICFSISVTNSYADEKSLSVDTTSTAAGYLRKNNDSQMLGKTFDRLIKAFQAGAPDAKAGLCELRTQSYDNGNIILVKKIEEHRYRNNYICDETVKKQSKTNSKTEHTVTVANAAQVAAKREEQERQAITITAQKLTVALREKQERAAADAARMAAEKLEQERLAAVKAEEQKALAAKAAAAQEQQKKEKMEQERFAAVKAEEEKALAAKAAAAKEQQQKEKMEQERLAADATRKAEEKLERERLIAAIAEEKRTIASKAEQERIAAIKTAKEHQEKERIKQAQAAAEQARLAAVKHEQERIASAAAQAKKDAAKAVTEQAAAAKASKERLAKERAEQIQAAVKAAQLAAEKQKRERIVAPPKDTVKVTASKPEVKPPAQTHAVVNRKPDSTPNPPKPGQPVPDLNVTSFSGMPVSPDYYRGSVLVIDFFAPWCQICRRHIPKIADLHNKFKKQGLQVLGLNVDNADKGAVTNFSSEMNMGYLTAQADETIQAKFGIRSVPAVYIVDKKGRIAGIFHTINDETDRTIESMVKKLLVAE